MNPSRPLLKNALRSVVDYLARALVAGLLMMWATMNCVNNMVDLMRGAPDRNWLLAGLFSIFTVVVPFALGVWIVIRLMNLGGNRKKAG